MHIKVKCSFIAKLWYDSIGKKMPNDKAKKKRNNKIKSNFTHTYYTSGWVKGIVKSWKKKQNNPKINFVFAKGFC